MAVVVMVSQMDGLCSDSAKGGHDTNRRRRLREVVQVVISSVY